MSLFTYEGDVKVRGINFGGSRLLKRLATGELELTFTGEMVARQMLRLFSDKGTTADNDEQYISFMFNDSADNIDEHARITVIQTDETTATEDASIRFDVMQAGTLLNDVLTIGPTAFIFNEDGDDLDFRVEGDNNTTLFNIDAGTDSVSFNAAVVAGASFALGDPTNRDLVTSVGYRFHEPAATINDTLQTGTLAIVTPNFFGIATHTADGTITYTDCPTVYIAGAPTASTSVTQTRSYALWVDAGDVRVDDNLRFGGTSGAATQTTADLTSGVTINTVYGAITLAGDELAAGAEATFTVTNSEVAADDVIILSQRSAGSDGRAMAWAVTKVESGSFDVTGTCLAATLESSVNNVLNFIVLNAGVS